MFYIKQMPVIYTSRLYDQILFYKLFLYVLEWIQSRAIHGTQPLKASYEMVLHPSS
jgi:hypothetical protein